MCPYLSAGTLYLNLLMIHPCFLDNSDRQLDIPVPSVLMAHVIRAAKAVRYKFCN